jgi:hypothetical protein
METNPLPRCLPKQEHEVGSTRIAIMKGISWVVLELNHRQRGYMSKWPFKRMILDQWIFFTQRRGHVQKVSDGNLCFTRIG